MSRRDNPHSNQYTQTSSDIYRDKRNALIAVLTAEVKAHDSDPVLPQLRVHLEELPDPCPENQNQRVQDFLDFLSTQNLKTYFKVVAAQNEKEKRRRANIQSLLCELVKAICALTGSRLPEQLGFLEPQTSVRVPQAHSNIASVRLTPVTANDVKRFITSEDKRSLAVESGHGIDYKDVISPAELTPKEKSERKQHKKTSKKKSGSKSTIVRWNVQPAQGNQKGQQRKDLQYAVRQSVYWYLAAQFTNQLKEKEEMKYNRILILRSFFKQFLAGKMPNQEKSTQQTYDLWVSYIAGSVKSHDHGKDEQKKEIVRQHVQAITHQLGRLSIVLRVSGKAQTRELVCQSLLLGRCQSVRQCGSLQLWHRAVHRAAGSSRQVQPTV